MCWNMMYLAGSRSGSGCGSGNRMKELHFRHEFLMAKNDDEFFEQNVQNTREWHNAWRHRNAFKQYCAPVSQPASPYMQSMSRICFQYTRGAIHSNSVCSCFKFQKHAAVPRVIECWQTKWNDKAASQFMRKFIAMRSTAHTNRMIVLSNWPFSPIRKPFNYTELTQARAHAQKSKIRFQEFEWLYRGDDARPLPSSRWTRTIILINKHRNVAAAFIEMLMSHTKYTSISFDPRLCPFHHD